MNVGEVNKRFKQENNIEKLKTYIIEQKNKIENSDDIPQSIYDNILWKIEVISNEEMVNICDKIMELEK